MSVPYISVRGCPASARSTTSRVRGFRVGLVVAILAIATGMPILGQRVSPEPSLEILGSREVYEETLSTWSVVYGALRLRTGPAGYNPKAAWETYDFNGEQVPSGVMPTTWEDEVEFLWSFGDTGEIFSTGERTVAQHRYHQDGAFTIQVDMKSTVSGTIVASATHEILVRNQPPQIWELAALRLADTDASFEFTAYVYDAQYEELSYHWDFGDGTTATTEEPEARHRFLLPGTYPVQLTVRDEHRTEGTETIQVVVHGRGDAPSRPDPIVVEDEVAAETAVSGFQGTISGALESDFRGEIRPFVGLFLGPGKGNSCRFVMTAWDPRKLGLLQLMADIGYLPQEGARYQLQSRYAQVSAQPNAEEYLRAYDQAGQASMGLGSRALQRALPRIRQLSAGSGADGEGQGSGERSDEEWADAINEGLRASGAGFVQVGDREEQPNAGAPVALSPFGVEKRLGFEGGGSLDVTILPHDRMMAKVDLTLVDPSTPSAGTIRLTGDFVLNLETATRDGLVMYACSDATFGVKSVFPPVDQQIQQRARVGITFDDEYDPDTLNLDTFKVGYPPRGGGELVTVPGRLVRGPTTVWFHPDEPWLEGVRYTAKVRAGEEGVRSRDSVPLEDSDGSGWYEWEFWTALDFDLALGNNLSCELFQTVRNPKLILDKPTVARVYANWREHPEVAPLAQRRQFDSRVVSIRTTPELSTLQTFSRPDLWGEHNVNKAQAEHTANLFGWTPREGEPGYLRLELKVRKQGEWRRGPRVNCREELWDRSPTLTVDWYMAPLGDWAGGGHRHLIDVAQRIAAAAETYAWQLFPFADVRFRPGQFAARGSMDWETHLAGHCPDPAVDGCIPSALRSLYSSGSSADVVLYFAPAEVLGGRLETSRQRSCGWAPRDRGHGGGGRSGDDWLVHHGCRARDRPQFGTESQTRY